MSFLVAGALSVFAVLGYLLGRQQLRLRGTGSAETRNEITRAIGVARELESIAYRMHHALAAHKSALSHFQRRLTRMENGPCVSWQDLCDRADELLKPTLRLSNDMSHSYAEVLQQMTHLASFAELRADPLTGINNRRAFDESLEAAVAAQSRYPAPLSLAMIDVDRFKLVNDTNGHLFGDRMLQELAQLLRANVRECDLLARYGGEEFAILMPRTNLSEACNLAERLRVTVANSMPLTVSVGLAAWENGDLASALVARADSALYAAKSAGRNNVHLHEGASGHVVGIRTKPGAKIAPPANVHDPIGLLVVEAQSQAG